MTPHKHVEIIKAWADGQKVEVLSITEGWVEPVLPQWSIWDQYRIKPEPAAPKWPQTTMTELDLCHELTWGGNGQSDVPVLVTIANAAIAHACESGQVVPAAKVREIEAKARAEGGKRNEDRDREVIWWALQQANVYPTSKFLDELVKKAPK